MWLCALDTPSSMAVHIYRSAAIISFRVLHQRLLPPVSLLRRETTNRVYSTCICHFVFKSVWDVVSFNMEMGYLTFEMTGAYRVLDPAHYKRIPPINRTTAYDVYEILNIRSPELDSMDRLVSRVVLSISVSSPFTAFTNFKVTINLHVPCYAINESQLIILIYIRTHARTHTHTRTSM